MQDLILHTAILDNLRAQPTTTKHETYDGLRIQESGTYMTNRKLTGQSGQFTRQQGNGHFSQDWLCITISVELEFKLTVLTRP